MTSPYRIIDCRPVLVLSPEDPAAGDALEAYCTALWRLYQRGETPAYCADAGGLLPLLEQVSGLRKLAGKCRRKQEGEL